MLRRYVILDIGRRLKENELDGMHYRGGDVVLALF